MIKIEKHDANGLKNDNIQIETDSLETYWDAKALFFDLKVNFPELGFFMQGDSCFVGKYWLMFESWSDNHEMFERAFEFAKERLKEIV